MRAALQPFLAPELTALQFAAKTLLAGGLALWLALRLDLGQPQWALMTVFVVSQPLSGMVVQKGLARLLGTLCGGTVAVLIMALCAQAPWLLLLTVGAWLGLCIATTTQLRSAWAYACMLAGYTVVIIVLPALNAPTGVFDQAVARSTEIGLGILCATAVSAILWPQHIQHDLLQQARVVWDSGLRTARGTLAGESAAYRDFLQLLGQIVAVDAQREHAWFEGHQGRRRARAMHGLSHALLRLLRLSRAVRRLWRQLEPADARTLAPWLEAVQALLAAPEPAQLQALRQRLRAATREEQSAAGHYGLRRLALLLDYLAAAGRALQAVEQDRPGGESPGVLASHRDLQSAAVFGLRGTLAFLALAAFWLASAWPSAIGALILLAVLCSLFASFDNAVQVSLGFLRGMLLAMPVAFVISQALLPRVNGYPLLCLVLGVPLFFGALGMAHRPTTGIATAFCLNTVNLVAPQNVMRFDAATFLNDALAMLVAVGCAVLAYRLIGLRDPHWHARRLLGAGLADLRQLTRRELTGADLWFAGRMADRLLQLARHAASLPAEQRRHWDSGLPMLDLGDELLHLRIALDKAGLPARQAAAPLRELAEVLRLPPAAARAEAFAPPCRALRERLAALAASDDRHLAEAALLQVESGWRQWCRQREEADGTA